MPGRATLWYAFLGGPIAWSAHLLASYPLVPLACERGSTTVLNLITLGTILLSLGAAGAGWYGLRRLRGTDGGRTTGEGPRNGTQRFDRARFMARVGLWMGLLFAFVILVEGLPPLLQSPCAAVGP